MLFTLTLALKDTLAVPDAPKVAKSELALGTKVVPQLAAVFQSLVAGLFNQIWAGAEAVRKNPRAMAKKKRPLAALYCFRGLNSLPLFYQTR